METTNLLDGIAQSIDLILRELSVFLKQAGGFLIAVIGFPTHVFGQDAALFLALAILFAAGAAFGILLWSAGYRFYTFILPIAEVYVEELIEQRTAREAAKRQSQAAVVAAEPAVPAAGEPTWTETHEAKAACAEPAILDRAGPL